MSSPRKPNADSGEMHRCSEAKPEQQQHSKKRPTRAAAPVTRSADKPDFDQSDRRPSPKRKASGPARTRHRQPAPSSTPSSTPDIAPAEVADSNPVDDET